MGKQKILTIENLSSIKELNDELYQEKLESGVNLKTVNGKSLLGKGNLVIKSGGDGDASIALLAYNWQSYNYYYVDDIRVYNKKLYRCTQEHSASDRWSDYSYYWQEYPLAELSKDVAYHQTQQYFANNFNSNFDSRLNSTFNDKFDARFDEKMDELLNKEY